MENTLVIIKPDGLKKRIYKDVLERFLKNGLSISHINMQYLDKEIIREHYAHLVDRPFYPMLEEFMLSGPVVIMIVSGIDAINKVRLLIGNTDPKKAHPGTIRGDYGDKECMTYNVIHASDSHESAIIEIERFYNIIMDDSKNRRVYEKNKN